MRSVGFKIATAACPGVHLPSSVPWPEPSNLPRLAAAAARELASCLARFTTEVEQLVPGRHPYRSLRVPLHVVREVQTGVTWLPQSLGEYDIGETGGMMTAIQASLCRLRSANQPMSPILGSLDIYYRLLGVAYTRPCANLTIRTVMRPLPLLFGIWHAYKHVVVSCHSRLRTWFGALQYSLFLNEPGGTSVYNLTKLRELDYIMLAVFPAAGHA